MLTNFSFLLCLNVFFVLFFSVLADSAKKYKKKIFRLKPHNVF
jgi:hypothetical protein